MKSRPLPIVSASFLLVFVILALLVELSPAFRTSDAQLAAWVNHLDLGTWVGSALVASSVYGREYFWVGVVAVLLLTGDRRTKKLAIGLCVLFVVGIATGEIAKLAIPRERPWLFVANLFVRVPYSFDSSFPSGHALIASIGAVYALATFRRAWLSGLLTVEAAIVCLSRVYVGAHYPSDVLAGVALGGAIALGGLYLGRAYLSQQFDRAAGLLTKALGEGPLSV